jgi:hypothetical protein
VEHVATQQYKRCLKEHLCNLAIRHSDGRSSSSSLGEILKEHKTDLILSRISSFVSVVGVNV